MRYDDILILISSHSLEDLPTDLGDDEAASLLNAFAVGWHPVCLASAGVIPSWHRADVPPELTANRLILVPNNCKKLLPGGWADHARKKGGIVITDLSDREKMVAAMLEPCEDAAVVDPELVADFHALGTCYILLELLTRQMHHFSSMDEVHLQREAVAAAKAAVAGDREGATTHLKSAFEVLLEARERFFPVDCYLLDLCLVAPKWANEHFEKVLSRSDPLNLLITGEDLEQIAADKPQMIARCKELWDQELLELIGGEWTDPILPLMSVDSVLWQFQHGRHSFQKWFGKPPRMWGRRRFGVHPMLPQILSRFGYQAAMHLVLDDGLYPDEEFSKLRWQGCDGTVIDAISRIPLAGDSASSYLRYPARMAESMQHDQGTSLILARWPDMRTPWLEDLRRTNKYAPVLGRFVTFSQFFQATDVSGRLMTYESKDYLTPSLIHAVARREQFPVQRHIECLSRRHLFDVVRNCSMLASLLKRQSLARPEIQALEDKIELAAPDIADPLEKWTDADQSVLEQWQTSAEELAEVILGTSSQETPGYLLINTLSFPRTVSVSFPTEADLAAEIQSPPVDSTAGESSTAAPEAPCGPIQAGGAVKVVQWEDERRLATVACPGMGFVWIPQIDNASLATTLSKTLLAEPNLLRNELFEVHIHDGTGGIARIKGHGRSPTRLSQQLTFRFPKERRYFVPIPGTDEQEEIKTQYAQMKCHESNVTSTGPVMGEIVTAGEIVDPEHQTPLAKFRQTVRVWRSRPVIDVEIEFSDVALPDGDPWSTYFTSRFAWNDSTAALTRGMLSGAHGVKMDRLEAPYYIEIADSDSRTTILTKGLTFHRKTGPRMLDSILLAEGELTPRFSFQIVIDTEFPMRAALDALSPVVMIPTKRGWGPEGRSGWFFHVDAHNVLLTTIMDAPADAPQTTAIWDQYDQPTLPGKRAYAVRLVETEGRAVRVKLRGLETPDFARQRDFQGRTVSELAIIDDAVPIDLTAYEIADIELRFEK
ncbi:MAG: hypothetical protein ACKVT0_20730 [Planctomycetaceae bacterium]